MAYSILVAVVLILWGLGGRKSLQGTFVASPVSAFGSAQLR
jgi:hypothetical protein